MQKPNKILLLVGMPLIALVVYIVSAHEMRVKVDVQTSQAEAQIATRDQKPPTAVHVPIKFDGEYLPRNLFIQISKAVNPAVVNISTTQKVRRPRGQMFFGGGPGGDPFQQFFEQFMGGGRGGPGGGGVPQQQDEQQVSSLGSGFIIEAEGLIVTNNHVIQNANEIKVQITEKSKKLHTATVVGHDPRTDLALIKIKPDEALPVCVLGNSDALEVGEWVAAFGNPYGHGHSMTKGIISAKEREIPGETNFFPFLQTDASINPGNSGGPLTNSAGEVIGVNSAIDARAQGIGFAIPINVLKKLLPQLRKGKVTRGFIGVSINDIDERIQKQLRLKSDKGALVLNVTPGSPADKAGIQNYDIIISFDAKPVENSRGLMVNVAEANIGKQVAVKILRDGKPMDLALKIVERSEETAEPGNQQGPQAPGLKAPYELGFTLSQLTPELAQQLEIAEAPPRAVVITHVNEGSVAEQAGADVGDVILDINRRRVQTPKDANKAFKRGMNTMRVLRGNGTALLFLETK